MIEIMDTTLRDGEQTSGVSFSQQEKLGIAKFLLSELGVDRIEIASARVSEGELQTVKKITEWADKAGFLPKIEVLGFVDGETSLNWIESVGGKVINLLTKGSLRHVTEQLRKTPQAHIDDIKRAIDLAHKKNISVNLYLEDWSNGMKNSPSYVFDMVDALCGEGVNRFMLPDTLGILNPLLTADFCTQMVKRYPNLKFDFHAHNDYDLAVSNVFAAVNSGISGIHTTINGLGERAGNAPLTSVLAVLHDQLGIKTKINEQKMYDGSKLVETYSGVRIPANKPIIGDNVFTQVAGVHADGDQKNNLYYLTDIFDQELMIEDFIDNDYGDTCQVIQDITATYDTAFIIYADAEMDSDFDIGWRTGYRLTGWHICALPGFDHTFENDNKQDIIIFGE